MAGPRTVLAVAAALVTAIVLVRGPREDRTANAPSSNGPPPELSDASRPSASGRPNIVVMSADDRTPSSFDRQATPPAPGSAAAAKEAQLRRTLARLRDCRGIAGRDPAPGGGGRSFCG